MSEHNSRDCAALVSLTVEKQLAAKYRDMQCLLPVEEIQVLEVVGWEDLIIGSCLKKKILVHSVLAWKQ